MNELRLRISLVCALAACVAASGASAAVTGHRPDAPPEADVYPYMRQGPGVDEQTVRDMQIVGDIEKAYFEEESLDPAGIDVRVEDGEVSLEGAVRSDEARKLAERIARETQNVRDVTSELRVVKAPDGET